LAQNDDCLLISGVQHFIFCKHQWGLIHIERLWDDNALTYEGHRLHERVHDGELKESRGDTYYSRGVAVCSDILRVQGVIDLIEFTRNINGIYIEEKGDCYIPRIVEYKKGVPKEGLEDKLQLVTLAMAFEEMKGIELDFGYLFYFGIKKREKVMFTKELRQEAVKTITEMHYYFDNRITPFPEKKTSCKSCSLEAVCSYRFSKKDAKKYISNILEENY
jgi:CRISPR-associated exonuclease Cas4